MFFKFKSKPIENKEAEQSIDVSIYTPLIECKNSTFTLTFLNGITAFLEMKGYGELKVSIYTPVSNITNRFKKFKPDNVIKAEQLVTILNMITKLPNVYTVHEIPDSCFNF